jgi:hypothetical protein
MDIIELEIAELQPRTITLDDAALTVLDGNYR